MTMPEFSGNELDKSALSNLVIRNINILGKRTSVRLEPAMWHALKDIARRENSTVHKICTAIHFSRTDETSLTAALRVFVMLYYRAAATEDGHTRAGHGDFQAMLRRANLNPSMFNAVAAPTEAEPCHDRQDDK